ncbi:MAG: Trm112 family protein, partial [Gammaproteobacteria bacterium]
MSFACPRCDRELDESGTGLVCAGCKVEFPLIAGIPWLFAEPMAALAEWRSRYAYRMQLLAAQHASHERALKDPDLLVSTRQRLTTLAAAVMAERTQINDILAPLSPAKATGKIETYL